MRLKVIGALAGLALFVSTAPAHAITFSSGDVFAAIGSGQVQHYSSAGALLETLNTTRGGFTTGMGFDTSGSLYVTNFSDASVSRFDVNGALTNAVFVNTGALGGAGTESIVFDNAGNFYVGNADGNRDIMKFNSAGAPLTSFNVTTTARGSDWMDLAADQTTMYYTSENFEIKRFDVATNTQLTDFASSVNRPKFAFRLLSGGDLIVANSRVIERYDSTGTVVQTYGLGTCVGCFALNLNNDGTSFWSGDFSTGVLRKYDIGSGSVLQTINTGSSSLFGVAVFGEITAGCPTCGSVPEPASLLLLSFGLTGIALRRFVKA